MSDRQELNRNLAQMLKGGVIMDVTTPEQAKIAEAAGACAVMALERIPADDVRHIDKNKFNVPFVCGARDLGEALRRIGEGATMIRTKGEPGTGDVVQAVTNWQDSKLLAKLSENLGPAMVGINADEIETIMEERGK